MQMEEFAFLLIPLFFYKALWFGVQTRKQICFKEKYRRT
jgi:hypothetical protein